MGFTILILSLIRDTDWILERWNHLAKVTKTMTTRIQVFWVPTSALSHYHKAYPLFRVLMWLLSHVRKFYQVLHRIRSLLFNPPLRSTSRTFFVGQLISLRQWLGWFRIVLNVKKVLIFCMRRGWGRKADLMSSLYQAPSPWFFNHLRREMIHHLAALICPPSLQMCSLLIQWPSACGI